MARVQVSGMSPNVQLQPQANPVNTFVQPEQSTPTAAEMRAKVLEGALSKASHAFDVKDEREYKEQMALKKDEIAITASADMIRMKAEMEPKLRGKSVEETTALLDEEFNRRYGDINNPYVKTAINGLFISYKTQAATAAMERIRQEQDARYADDVTTNVADYLATAEKENHDDARVALEVDSIFKIATANGRMSGVDFNKRLLGVIANGDPTQRGWRYIQAKKLDRTGNPHYEALVDQIRRGIVKSQNDTLDFELKSEAAKLVEAGGVNQMKAFKEKWAPILIKRGISPDWMIEKEGAARNRANELNDIHARKVATTRAIDFAIANDGVVNPEGENYTDHKGNVHAVPASVIRQGVLDAVRKNPDAPNRGRIETRVVDPMNTKIFTDGVAYLTDINSGEMVTLNDGSKVPKKQIAGQKFSQALKAFTDIYNRGGEEAAAKQAGDLFDLYMGAVTLSRMGSTPEDIVLGLSNRKSGKMPKVTKAQVESMRSDVLSKTDNGTWMSLWMLGDEAQNTTYIDQQLERLYGLYRQSALSDDAAMETAKDVFKKTHTLVEQDGVFLLVNTNSLSRNTALSGGSDKASPSEMIKKLGNASKQFASDIEEQFPEAIGDRKIFLQPNIMDPNRFTLTITGGGVVANSYSYTAAQINEADAKWKLGAKQRGIKMRERIYQESQVSP